MQIRETVTTLRRCFILCGASGCYLYTAHLFKVLDPGVSKAVLLPAIPEIVGLGFALGYLYLGGNLRELLRTSPLGILTFLQVHFTWSSANFLLDHQHGLETSMIVGFILGLLFFWYLLHNVNRLSTEARASSPTSSIDMGPDGSLNKPLTS